MLSPYPQLPWRDLSLESRWRPGVLLARRSLLDAHEPVPSVAARGNFLVVVLLLQVQSWLLVASTQAAWLLAVRQHLDEVRLLLHVQPIFVP